MNQIEENKNLFETCFPPTWEEIKDWSYLELITSTSDAQNVLIFLQLSIISNERFAIIDLRNENEQNTMSYSQCTVLESQFRSVKCTVVTRFSSNFPLLSKRYNAITM